MRSHAPLLSLALSLVVSCKPSAHEPAPVDAAAPPAASASAAPSASASPLAGGGDEVRPVYPSDAGPPDPLAEKLCNALVIVPRQRQATCRKKAPDVIAGILAGQCVRTLTAAMHTHAVAVASTDVDRCVDAMNGATSSCDSVASKLPLPAECDGLIHGTLAAKARCHSSLECAGTLRCQGLSAIDVGTCAPAKPARQGCDLARDTLATYTRQDETIEHSHPECAGYCRARQCRDIVPPGGKCTTEMECGAGKCEKGTCSAAATTGGTPGPSSGK